MAGIIGELTEVVPTVSAQSLNKEIHDLFKSHPKCGGIVIVEKTVPIAMITRMSFYQKMGTLYGYNLYINKPISQLMNKNILTVDYTTSIIDVSRMAMDRKEEELYDFVIITKNGHFEGVVSISRLLIKFAELQAQIASFLNPLTGLPGNKLIEDKLNVVVNNEKFSVLYIDIDNFKTYNDVYGFGKGDKVIQSIANMLNKFVKEYDGFLGHIGGDDFLAVFDHYIYKKCCDMIFEEFEHLKPTFYFSKHLEQKYVFTEDREGIKRKIPLISLSIAVVTNEHYQFTDVEEVVEKATRLKRICKKQPGNVYLDSVKV